MSKDKTQKVMDSLKRKDEQIAQMKKDLRDNISFEVRTPMSVILGYIDLLKMTELNKVQIDYLEKIKNSCQGMVTNIESLLEYSVNKSETGSLNLEKLKQNKLSENIKALIVDDDIANRELLKEFLGTLGVESDMACNGQEAIDQFQKNQFDICFMDIMMPEVDGLTATKYIREKIDQKTPIIGLTAMAENEVHDKSKQAGMTNCLRKPIDFFRLKQEILKYVDK